MHDNATMLDIEIELIGESFIAGKIKLAEYERRMAELGMTEAEVDRHLSALRM
jgi:hypothetical protein